MTFFFFLDQLKFSVWAAAKALYSSYLMTLFNDIFGINEQFAIRKSTKVGQFDFWPSYENFQSSRPRGSRQTLKKN
jgi:hypothetical protein